MKRYLGIAMAICFLGLEGCARTSADQTKTSRNHDYVLAEEPTGALDVMDIRERAKDNEPVVVLGSVGGGLNPWIDGRAAFMLVDERVVPSCEGEQCDPDCPQCTQELAEATILVKFVDSQGKVLSTDARELLGLKEQQTVVVRGVAIRDKAGSISIIANGVYARE